MPRAWLVPAHPLPPPHHHNPMSNSPRALSSRVGGTISTFPDGPRAPRPRMCACASLVGTYPSPILPPLRHHIQTPVSPCALPKHVGILFKYLQPSPLLFTRDRVGTHTFSVFLPVNPSHCPCTSGNAASHYYDAIHIFSMDSSTLSCRTLTARLRYAPALSPCHLLTSPSPAIYFAYNPHFMPYSLTLHVTLPVIKFPAVWAILGSPPHPIVWPKYIRYFLQYFSNHFIPVSI